MKFQVQSSLRSLKLVNSSANPLLRLSPFILIFFRYDVRLSLHPFLRYILICLNCAPTQLSPSVWCAMIGMYILWKLRNFSDPTFIGSLKTSSIWCCSAGSIEVQPHDAIKKRDKKSEYINEEKAHPVAILLRLPGVEKCVWTRYRGHISWEFLISQSSKVKSQKSFQEPSWDLP